MYGGRKLQNKKKELPQNIKQYCKKENTSKLVNTKSNMQIRYSSSVPYMFLNCSISYFVYYIDNVYSLANIPRMFSFSMYAIHLVIL